MREPAPRPSPGEVCPHPAAAGTHTGGTVAQRWGRVPGLLSLLLSWCGQELGLHHPAPHLLRRPPSASLPTPPPPSPGEPSGLDRRPLRLGPRLILGPLGPGLLSPALLSWDALPTGLPASFWSLAQQPECSLKRQI